MTWKNGRELATASNGTHSVSYDYDVNSLRTYKIVDGVRHDYTYASGQLLRETYTGDDTEYTLDFLYDQSGRPYMLYLTTVSADGVLSTPYYYILNLQGDVIHLVNTSGVAVASYTYDPYGSILSSTGSLANVNPLRYRGYYYDVETGFYYLQSRYYDPMLGRFINADSYASTGQGFLGYNMFAYCNNCPPIMLDSAGTDAVILLDEDSYGHTGALIEDENGKWYHFYYGGNQNTSFGRLGTLFGVSPVIRVELFTGDPHSLDSVNEKGSTGYGGTYSNLLYLEGDFSKSVEKAKSRDKEILGDRYYALSNNCNHVTYRLLAASETKYSGALLNASKTKLPKKGFRIMVSQWLCIKLKEMMLK